MTDAAGVSIAAATGGDVGAVAALAAEVLREGWSESGFAATLAGEGSVCRVARAEGERLVGFLVGHRVGDDLEVLALAVRAAWRRRGIARALLMAALGDPPVRRVLLEVRSENAGALAFYRELGFEIVGSRRGYYADGDDALLLTWRVGVGGTARTGVEGEAA